MVILSEIGVPYADLDQDDLYESSHDHNQYSDWKTDPYGLRYTLDDRAPTGFANTFVVHKPTTEAEGTRDVVHTLHKYEVSPAVLVFGPKHWITVPGVQTDVEPVQSADYTVEGFWIHNSVTREPGELHSRTDVCGSGGANGSSNEYLTYWDWKENYFTGCDYDSPTGHFQFISVCDPDVRRISVPRRSRVTRRMRGDKLISKKDAMRLSEDGIKTHHLLRDRRVSQALGRSQPLDPSLVVRLDRRNSYYYLVPWGTRRSTRALTRVDARFGTFCGIRLLDKAIRNEFIDREETIRGIEGTRIRLDDGSGTLMVHRDVACHSPTLVWQPCWESWSPYLPFHQITIGSDTIYRRIDGRVFTELTTTGRGA
jgi:hypothetical protein